MHVFDVKVHEISLRATQISLERGRMQVKIAVPWGFEDGYGGYGGGSGYGGGVFLLGWFQGCPKKIFFWGKEFIIEMKGGKDMWKKSWGKLKKTLLGEYLF